MRLIRIALKNFRCYKKFTAIDLGDITTLIGKNECGKSTVLDALQIFFDDAIPDCDDATMSGDKSEVTIACTFDGLPQSLVIDADYPTDLASEYLLNEDGQLEIHKVYTCALKKPKLLDVYARCCHPTTEGASDLLQLKNAQLKERAKELGIALDGVDTRVNTQLRRAVWSAFDDLAPASQLVPLSAETAKRIWDMLKLQLPAYAVFKSDRPSTDQDAEAQDPMKTAIKEAIKEKEDELEKIAEYVELQVEDIAKRTVEKLRDMDPALASELRPRFTPPAWANVFKVSLTGDEDIPINKRGSGIRRLILLNFFRAKAEQRATERAAPSVIYAVEEPETSQHPDNQRMLVRALTELALHPDCQVILTTHVPALARLLPLESLRYLEITGDGARLIHSGDDQTYELVSRALGVLPDTNVRVFVGVEGPNDINFLTSLSAALHAAGENVPDLEREERDSRVVFVPLGGGNLAQWSSRLAQLNIPEFYIFDRGPAPPKVSPHQSTVDAMNARENCTARLTGKKEMENYLHPEAIFAARGVKVSFGDFDDVPALVAQSFHEESESSKAWSDLEPEDRRKKEARAKLWLNTGASSRMTPAMLDERDSTGQVRAWLAEIGKYLTTRRGA